MCKPKIIVATSSRFIADIMREEWMDSDFFHIPLRGESGEDTEISIDSGIIESFLPSVGDIKDEEIRVILHADKLEQAVAFFHSLASSPSPLSYLTLISTEEGYSTVAGADVDENFPLRPASSAGNIAVAIEKEARLWAEASSTPLIILRTATPFGSGMEGWPVTLFHQVLAGSYLHVRGIAGRLSTVMGCDLAHASRLTATLPGIYNVADGVGPTWLKLAEAMSANAGAQKRMITLPAQWADIAWKFLKPLPAVRDSLSPEVREHRSMSRNLSSRKLREATGMTFYNTLEVLARTDRNYPYKD